MKTQLSSFNPGLKFLFVFTLLFGLQKSNAQVSNYSFAQSTTTFTTISGGTVVGAIAGSWDDGNLSAQNIGFNFTYNGTVYSTFGISCNGYIILGSGTVTNTYCGTEAGQTNFIAPFGVDLIPVSSSAGEVRYQTTGLSPNRKLVCQWLNAHHYGSANGTSDDYSFQVILNEGTNSIQFVYGTMLSATSMTTLTGCSDASNAAPGIGMIGTTSTDFNVRKITTGTNSWATSVAGTALTDKCELGSTNLPASGLTYTYTVPVPMLYGSSTTVQGPVTAVAKGATNQQIVSVQVLTSGTLTPFTLSKLYLNTTGTTNLADISNVRVFYTGLSSTFSPTTQFGSTISSPGSSFNISGTQVLAGGTNYFWVAYDIAATASNGNVLDAGCDSIVIGANTYIPSVTSPAGSRSVKQRLNGNITVGSGGDYTTLTEALADLSNLGVTGPVTFSLIDNFYGPSETFPVNVSSYFGMGASNPVIIRPSASQTNVVVQGNASSLITFNGARYITIDGRPGGVGANNLKFINANTGGPVLQFINDAISNTVTYATVFSANASASSGAIVIGGSTGTLGNDSITLSNLNIRSSGYPATLANGILCQGQSATIQNEYNTITSNNIYAFTLNGILVSSTNTGNGSFWRITNNSFYDTAATTSVNSMTAINFIPGGATSFSHTISGNYIGGSAPLAAGGPWTLSGLSGSLTGIAVTTSSGVSPTFIQNNFIQNINLTGGSSSSFSFTGIATSGSGTYTIGGSSLTANTIGHASNVSSIRSLNNSVLLGISNSGSGVIVISNNLIANLTDSNTNASAAIRGITNSSGSNVTIASNSLYNFNTQSTLTGTQTSATLLGISVTSSGNPQVISGNIIGGSNGIFRNLQTGSHTMIGIYYGGASGNNIIQNNTISNFISGSIYSGVTSGAAINGLLISSGGTINTVSGNTISMFTHSGAGASQVNGICANSGSTTNIFQNNSIYGMGSNATTNTSVTSSAAVNGMNINTTLLHNLINNTIDSLVCSSASATQVNGIYLTGTTGNTVSGNTITRISSSGTSTGTLNSSAIVGLNFGGSGLNQTVSLNTIHSLSNSAATAAANIVGIYFTSSTSPVTNTSIVARNLIHSFSLATTAAGSMSGIVIGNTYAAVQNNMIRIGVNGAGTILTGPYNNRGIYLAGTTYGSTSGQGNGLRLYHNTVYMNGSFTTGTSSSYALDFSSTIFTGNVDVRNNILANLSSNSGGTGSHYALRLLSVTNINSNFNMFYVPGTGGVATILSATPYASLAGASGWNVNTKLDVNSGIANPNFVTPLGTASTINLRVQSPHSCRGNG